jgi:hypothetical protein
VSTDGETKVPNAGMTDVGIPDPGIPDAEAPFTTTCPTDFPNEVFRDDFIAATLDIGRWSVAKQNNGLRQHQG